VSKGELTEAIAQAIREYATDVAKRAEEPGYFGDMTTGEAVSVALAAAEGITRQVGRRYGG